MLSTSLQLTLFALRAHLSLQTFIPPGAFLFRDRDESLVNARKERRRRRRSHIKRHDIRNPPYHVCLPFSTFFFLGEQQIGADRKISRYVA